MRLEYLLIAIILGICDCSLLESDYVAIISNNPGVMQGGTINFTCFVMRKDGTVPEGRFQFYWRDNAPSPNSAEVQSDYPNVTWSVTYPRGKYNSSEYAMYVDVQKWKFMLYWNIAFASTRFNITNTLNGMLVMQQTHFSNFSHLISTNETVHQHVDIYASDSPFLHDYDVVTYWFVDCANVANSSTFSLNYTYNDPDKDHLVEALVVGTKKPPITTTTSPTTSPTTTTTTTTAITTTTPKPTTSTTKPKSDANLMTPALAPTEPSTSIKKRSIPQGFARPFSIAWPYICGNTSTVPPDPNKLYGYFQRQITVRNPLTNIQVTGKNWIQNYELLSLGVSCSGSPPFDYCVYYYEGAYTPSGNETCEWPVRLQTCQFNITRYMRTSDEHTLVIILNNELNKFIQPVRVTVYKTKRVAQLSVIIVPVSFCLLAVVSIIFGVAYLVQSARNSRYTVEVADFDFQFKPGDGEYKKFWQRVREAFIEAFYDSSLAQIFVSTEVPHSNINHANESSSNLSADSNSPTQFRRASTGVSDGQAGHSGEALGGNLRYGSIE